MRLIEADALKNKKHFTKEQALKIALNTKAPFSSHDTQYIFNTAQIEEMLNLAATAAITNAPTVQREGWKPIKSAPKGEAVLVAGGDCDYPCVANWSGHPDECWCVDGQMDTYAEIGWPTHWQPLPEPPNR